MSDMPVTQPPPSMPSAPRQARGGNGWTWAALLVGLLALAGTLYLSLGMGLRACPLCFYQRTFVMAVVGVLLVGLVAGGTRPGLLSLLVLPLCVGGLGVAYFHVYLEQQGILECPYGILGWGTAPQQSLGAFVLLTLLVLVDVRHSLGSRGRAWAAALGPLVLGALFAWGAIASTPAAPKPTALYKLPLDEDGCRVPYRQ